MAKTKAQKTETIKEYEDKIKDSNALLIIRPTQITPNEANELRKKLLESDASFNVVKNSLFELSLKNAKVEIDMDFTGENSVIFVKGDISTASKTLNEFLEEIDKGEIRGGVFNESEITKDEILEIAKLPPREVLLGQTVGTIAAPLTNFMGVLNANARELVNVLKNIADEKEEK